MSRVPLVTARELEKIVFLLGFEKIRQKGSHAFYRHGDGRTTTIPFHSSRVITRPLLREILNDLEISVDDYMILLKQI